MKRLILILLSVLSLSAYAQKADELAIYKVHISMPDRNIIAEIRPAGSVTAAVNNTYYWFSANAIKHTQGSYSGHLLNGPYKEFYPNKNLKEQGTFRKGLKTGVWKSWSPEGILLQQITWDNGKKAGDFELYDDKGNLKQKGVYKDDSVQTEAKHGSFWKKINIFKKKDKQPEP
jgi:hypothetical protein